MTNKSEESTGPSYQATLSGELRTELVNMNTHGRAGVTPVDRITQFGNPFLLKKDGGTHTREESVEDYRAWFKQKVENDSEFRAAVEELRGKTLGCWCVSEPITHTEEPYDTCHGEILLAYLNGEMDV